MITVGMNYEIREGKDQAFEKMFGKVLDVMGKIEGHVKTHLYRDVFETRSYLIVSEWNTRAAFDSFIESEQFSKVTDWATPTFWRAGRGTTSMKVIPNCLWRLDVLTIHPKPFMPRTS